VPRQINARFLLISLLIVAILTGGIHLLHGYQMRRNALIFLREARQARDRKDAGAAFRFYQLYLDVHPNNVSVLAEYGMLLADLGQRPAAYATLEKALRLDTNQQEARRKLISVALQLGRFRDAKEHIEVLRKASPEDVELLELGALCETGLGNFNEAVGLYRQVLEKAPDRFNSYVLLADLLERRLGRSPEAEQVLQDLVGRYPGDCKAWAIRADYFRSKRRFDDALADAQRALQLDPDNLAALLVAAESAREKRQLDRALEFAARAVTSHPKVLAAYQVKANVEVAAGRIEDAIQTIQKARELDPANLDLRWHLANLHIDAKQLAAAEEQLKVLEQSHYSAGLLEYLRGRVAIAQGQWRLARQLLRRARAQLAADTDQVRFVDYWLGVVEGQLGNRDEQLLAFRRAISADPFWVAARLGAANALAALGQTEQAIEESRQAFSLTGGQFEAGLQLLSLLVLKNLVSRAEAANWEEAEKLVKALQEVAPDDWRPTLLHAEILVGQRKLQEAQSLLAAAREKWSNEIEVWLAGAALARRLREFDQTEAILGEAEKHLGDSSRLRLARAQYLLERYGEKAADQIRRLEAGIAQWPASEKGSLLVGLGAVLLQLGDYDTARRYSSEAAELMPNSLRARILLFDLALQAADRGALARVVREIEEIEGRGALWHYGRAVELVLTSSSPTDNRLEEARGLLMQAAAMRPAWSRIPLLLAEISERQKDPERALHHYQRAFDLGEDNPRAIRRLLQLLYERQRYAEADRVLRRLEELRAPFTGELVRLASEISLRLQEFDRALELARQSATVSNDYRDRVWLAQVLTILGLRARAEGRSAQGESMLADAEREFRQAVTLAPHAVDAWVTFIRFYGVTGQPEKADALLAEAEKTLGERLGLLAQAHCYTLLGRFDEAERIYEKALEAEPDNPAVIRAVGEFYLLRGKADLAAQQLEKLIGKESRGEASDLRWARRTLAFVLSQRGDYQSISRGLQVLEPNLAEPAVEPADWRVQALLLAQHPQRRMRQQALQVLERLVDRPEISDPRDRYVLARLYLRAGDTAKAAQQMRTLLTVQGNIPEFVAFYLRILLARDDLAEAELWMRRLQQLAPDVLETADIQAEIHARRGRPAEAVAVLRQFLERPIQTGAEGAPQQTQQQPGKEDNTLQELELRSGLVAATLMRVSILLQETGDYVGAELLGAEGEQLFRQFAEKAPPQWRANAYLLLAGFLARRGRVAEAVQLLSSWADQGNVPSLQACLRAIVSQLPENAPEWSVLASIVKKRVANGPADLPILLLDGEFSVLVEDYPAAERVYRRILEEDPSNFVALNNLAVTLAILGQKLEEAESLARRAMEVAGPRPEVLDTLALVLLARGKFADALRVINEALDDSSEPVLYLRQAQILNAMGEQSRSRDALAQAEKAGLRWESLAPSDRRVYRSLKQQIGSEQSGGKLPPSSQKISTSGLVPWAAQIARNGSWKEGSLENWPERAAATVWLHGNPGQRLGVASKLQNCGYMLSSRGIEAGQVGLARDRVVIGPQLA
jgi:tetratricopeptide (TPR) repeat protein